MFVQGGYVIPGYGLYYAGNNGIYWSAVGRDSSSAYYLGFYSGLVYPSNYYDRYHGFSVRRVALGS